MQLITSNGKITGLDGNFMKRCEACCKLCKNRETCPQLHYYGVEREVFFEYDKETNNEKSKNMAQRA